jgi:hypothetical protein
MVPLCEPGSPVGRAPFAGPVLARRASTTPRAAPLRELGIRSPAHQRNPEPSSPRGFELRSEVERAGSGSRHSEGQPERIRATERG